MVVIMERLKSFFLRRRTKATKVYIIRREAIFGDPVKFNLSMRRKYKGNVILK